jgi:hypothetical protein
VQIIYGGNKMRLKFNIHKIAILLVAASVCHAEQPTNQSQLKVYETPNTEAKVISQINPSNGITILPSNWVQVKDMTTNKTGWVTQEELNKALKQDNVWVKDISRSPNGNFESISEIRTGRTATEEYQNAIKEVRQQHKNMNENFTKALEQIKQIEESLFEKHEDKNKVESAKQSPSYWSSFLQTNITG